MIDKDRLRTLHATRTQGEWQWLSDEIGPHAEIVVRRLDIDTQVASGQWLNDGTARIYIEPEDASLIVAAVNALPELLDRIDALEAAALASLDAWKAADEHGEQARIRAIADLFRVLNEVSK